MRCNQKNTHAVHYYKTFSITLHALKKITLLSIKLFSYDRFYNKKKIINLQCLYLHHYKLCRKMLTFPTFFTEYNYCSAHHNTSCFSLHTATRKSTVDAIITYGISSDCIGIFIIKS